ncbi:MAG: VOC family protein, partial [Chitinophagaceae bacterium]
GEMQVYDYGKFGWILDPEGNKIELWEPNDKAFDEMTPDTNTSS